ncbi:hypothetical protein KUCAC02_026704 [Chaenocephalus aceratus]|nr:hypothetical protein KUCAC02_026704 [Chaenocephalus aceratus]
MRDRLHALVKRKPFYCSLLFDGSMDKSTSEKEVVSIKLIENGKPRIRLLGFPEPESCDAAGILKVIREKRKENHLNLSRTGCTTHHGTPPPRKERAIVDIKATLSPSIQKLSRTFYQPMPYRDVTLSHLDMGWEKALSSTS